MLQEIKTIIEEILDIEGEEISAETYIIRDLEAESIDLLEIAVALNSNFDVKIIDDDIFMRSLRLYVTEAKDQGEDTVTYIASKYPFVTEDRIKELLEDMDKGPALKVKDLISYVEWRKAQ